MHAGRTEDIVLSLIALISWAIIQIVVWWRPMGAFTRERDPILRGTLAYMAGTIIVIVLSYLLDLFHRYSRLNLWWGWIALAVGTNALLICSLHGERTRWRTRAGLGLVLGSLAFMGFSHLQDIVRHSSMAGGDSYQFFRCFHRVICEHHPLDYYLSGLAVGVGTVPWRTDPYMMTRVAPLLVSLGSVLPMFAVWRGMTGIRAGLLVVCAWTGSYCLYILSAYYPLFIQWTTVPLCVALILHYLPVTSARNCRHGRSSLLLAMTFFAVTATYGALYISALIGVYFLVECKTFDRHQQVTLASACLIVPVTIVTYYSVLLPIGLPESKLDLVRQASLCSTYNNPDVWARYCELLPSNYTIQCLIGENAPAPIQTAIVFLIPKRWPWAMGWLRLLVILFVTVVVVVALRREWLYGRRIRSAAMAVALSLVSSLTGILELPGYAGRSLYMALLLLLPVVASVYMRIRLHNIMKPEWALGCNRQRRFCFGAGIILLSWLPTMVYPPSIGESVPVSPIIQPRVVPDSDVIMDMLAAHPTNNIFSSIYVQLTSAGVMPPVVDAIMRMGDISCKAHVPGTLKVLSHGKVPSVGEYVIYDCHDKVCTTNRYAQCSVVFSGASIGIYQVQSVTTRRQGKDGRQNK